MAGNAREIIIRFLGDSKNLITGTDAAESSLKKLKTQIANTDSTFGKLKIAGGGATDFIKEHAGAMALGAGAALVGFGIKAVGAFEDTAKAAIDMSKTTGLGIEDASRWIGVGKDYEIGADTLTGSIGKITKSISDVKWADFGIATHNAAGQARDANDILLDTLSKLSAMPNKTAQAQEGFKLLDRGRHTGFGQTQTVCCPSEAGKFGHSNINLHGIYLIH